MVFWHCGKSLPLSSAEPGTYRLADRRHPLCRAVSLRARRIKRHVHPSCAVDPEERQIPGKAPRLIPETPAASRVSWFGPALWNRANGASGEQLPTN